MDILNIIIGVIISAVIGYYFYWKGIIKAKLSVNIEKAAGVFGEIDTNIKKNIDIFYNREKINHLINFEFLIKNRGNKCIKDLIDPLTLKVPDTLEIVELSIREIRPDGRKIEANVDRKNNSAVFHFKILNPKESFKVSLFLKEKTNATSVKIDKNYLQSLVNEIDFFITSEDLPPKLTINYEDLSVEESITGKDTVFSNTLTIIASFAIMYTIYNLTYESSNLFFPRFKEFSYGLFYGDFVDPIEIIILKFSIFSIWIISFSFSIRGVTVLLREVLRKIGN